MKKIFSLVLATLAATTMAFAAVQQDQATLDCDGSKTIKATPAEGYHFVRWEKDGSPIEGEATLLVEHINADVTYEAIFAINTYTIRFMNGADVLQSSSVEHGQTPVYSGVEPTKAQDAQYTYAFAGWGEIAVATADHDYVAQFTPTLRSYTITFYDEDGMTELWSHVYNYGETPSYGGETPTKASTAQYDYSFIGFGEMGTVKGDAAYIAMYSETVRSYAVTFKNGEAILQNDPVAYGAHPTYTGETPTKATDAEYTYTFSGWTDGVNNYGKDDELPAVQGEKTYSATFNQTKRTYHLEVLSADTEMGTVNDLTGDYDYGTELEVSATPKSCYQFDSWSDSGAQTHTIIITNDITLTATFTAKTVKITIKSGDDSKGTVEFLTEP